MFFVRMWVMYEGFKKLDKPKLYRNVRVYSDHKKDGDKLPFIKVEGEQFLRNIVNPHVHFGYNYTKISGLVENEYIDGVGFVHVHQELNLIPSMLYWDSIGGAQTDLEHGILRDRIEIYVPVDEQKDFNKGKSEYRARMADERLSYEIKPVRKRKRANSAR